MREQRWPAADESLHAAVLLARARNGDDTLLEAEFAARLDVPGRAAEVARAASLMLGALGQALVDRGVLGAVDGTELVAAGLQRLQRAETVPAETLPFVAGLLTAALVARTDTLDWLDRIGPQSNDLAPTVEVLAALIALVDTAYGQPGLGNELVTSVLP